METNFLSFQEGDFQDPLRECDLVMKGGITSGIVYPPVVMKLAGNKDQSKRYRFRCIGGTSAGAIAAAVTAAAEYGRENQGFTKLQNVSKSLMGEDFLFNLFQPSPELKPLMDLLVQLLVKKPESKDDQQAPNQAAQQLDPKISTKNSNSKLIILLQWLLKNFKLSPLGLGFGLLGAIILAGISLVVFFVISRFTATPLNFCSFSTPILVLATLLVFLGCWGVNLYDMLFKQLANNFFGICNGYKS